MGGKAEFFGVAVETPMTRLTRPALEAETTICVESVYGWAEWITRFNESIELAILPTGVNPEERDFV